MSSTTSTTSPSALQACHVDNMLLILRRANEHYSRVAASVRSSIRPTYHARKRAYALRLKVSIEKALKLDPAQISTIPLPVLDRGVTHAAAGRSVTVRARPMLRCIIPKYPQSGAAARLEQLHEILSAGSVYSTVSLTDKSSREVQCAPQRALTSRWSTVTDNSEELEVEQEENGITYSSDYEEGMDLAVSPESPDNDVYHVQFTTAPSAPVAARANGGGRRLRPRLDVPIDVSRLSWGSNTSSGSSSGSGSDYSRSSLGPETPPVTTEELPTLMIRIKRKSISSDTDMVEDTLEKRPKYERKEWLMPATQRMPAQRMTSTRRY
ncbi:hypothetical protein B0H34DRAFT_57598 [Crassisporium funariophilum]|nr:hypothetical protein B0H34DRAFT_57598 [Crassisporium funariophilum]